MKQPRDTNTITVAYGAFVESPVAAFTESPDNARNESGESFTQEVDRQFVKSCRVERRGSTLEAAVTSFGWWFPGVPPQWNSGVTGTDGAQRVWGKMVYNVTTTPGPPGQSNWTQTSTFNRYGAGNNNGQQDSYSGDNSGVIFDFTGYGNYQNSWNNGEGDVFIYTQSGTQDLGSGPVTYTTVQTITMSDERTTAGAWVEALQMFIDTEDMRYSGQVLFQNDKNGNIYEVQPGDGFFDGPIGYNIAANPNYNVYRINLAPPNTEVDSVYCAGGCYAVLAIYWALGTTFVNGAMTPTGPTTYTQLMYANCYPGYPDMPAPPMPPYQFYFVEPDGKHGTWLAAFSDANTNPEASLAQYACGLTDTGA